VSPIYKERTLREKLILTIVLIWIIVLIIIAISYTTIE